ncbi:hypothetical protein ALC57_13371 [Trachymyrmex cornetzi]|uniref:Uncharacterized protein n=1 Tax=Trachymyrmex cornetzi TaxID=471704 RepID=A0A151IZA0_9HYME|nr:hypothetical protein ALC57_13371 [Trachymyrmex cornetzi]
MSFVSYCAWVIYGATDKSYVFSFEDNTEIVDPPPPPCPLSPRIPPYFYHPFFSFLYLIAALFMPGPANKHMNARAFSRAHTTRP